MVYLSSNFDLTKKINISDKTLFINFLKKIDTYIKNQNIKKIIIKNHPGEKSNKYNFIKKIKTNGFKLEKAKKYQKLEDLLTSKQQNDLYDAAVSLVPQISQILTLLRELPGVIGVGMSGSGATCFAIFERGKTSKINEALGRLNGTTWWHKLTYLLP